MVQVRYELFASPSPLLNGGDVLSIWSGAPKVVTSEVSLSTLIAQELAKRVRAVERDAHDRVAAVERAAQKRINDLEQRIGIEVLVKALFVMLCNVDGKLVEIGDTGYLGSMPTEIRALLARFVAEAETKALLQFENRKDGITIESRAATEAALQAKTAAEARAAKAREAERVATEEAQKLRDKVSSLSTAIAAEEKKTVVALKAVGEAKSKMKRVELELETANTGWAAANVEQSKAVEKAWKSETKAAALERQLQLVQRTAAETRSAAEASAKEVEALKYKLQQMMEEVAKANEEKMHKKAHLESEAANNKRAYGHDWNALKAFYEDTPNGAKYWKIPKHGAWFEKGNPVSTWWGILVDSDGYVVALEPGSSVGIDGALPGATSGFKALQDLNLADCSKLYALPDLSGLTDLSSVKLPPHMETWEWLGRKAWDIRTSDFEPNTLELNFTGYGGSELPERLCRCRSLHTLNLSSCRQLKTLPSQFEELVSLRALDLGGCTALRAEALMNVAGCKALESLRLSGLKQLSALPGGLFAWCASLHALDLENCSGLLSLPPELGMCCPNLKTLNLDGCYGLRSMPDLSMLLPDLEVLNVPRQIVAWKTSGFKAWPPEKPKAAGTPEQTSAEQAVKKAEKLMAEKKATDEKKAAEKEAAEKEAGQKKAAAEKKLAKIEGASRAVGQKAATAALQIQNKEKSRSHQEGDGDEEDEEDEDNLEDDDDDSDDDAGDDAGDDAHNHPPSTSRNRKEAVTAADTALATAREQAAQATARKLALREKAAGQKKAGQKKEAAIKRPAEVAVNSENEEEEYDQESEDDEPDYGSDGHPQKPSFARSGSIRHMRRTS